MDNNDDILRRVKLIMEYDTSITYSENLNLQEQRPESMMDRQSNALAQMVGRSKEDAETVNQVAGLSPIKMYTCVPNVFNPFINYIIKNKSTLSKKMGIDEKNLIYFTKLALGIMYRETKLGQFTEFSDQAQEALRTFGLGFVADAVIKYNYGPGKTASLGYGQFKPETWTKYGLDKKVGSYDQSFNATSQGLGVLYMLVANYKEALSVGLKTGPSQNPILTKYGIISQIQGTGNNALDLAIVSHNMSKSKTMVKYCTTNHPLYAGPCNKSQYTPYTNKSSFNPNSTLLSKVTDAKLKKFPGTLTVNTGKVIENYFPNLKGPNHTGIGYLEEVVKQSKTYNCF
jgi:hypothetical protein